jgi:heat shock protein HslJ
MKNILLALFLGLSLSACSSTSNFDDVNTAKEIEDVKWLLDGSNGKGHMTFVKADKRIYASAGCNGLGGGYKLVGDKLETEEFVSTLMYCDGLMENEAKLANTLRNTNRVLVANNKLTLFDGSTILATFTAE